MPNISRLLKICLRDVSALLYVGYFFYCYCDHRELHSFPTRRSSDLKGPTNSLPSTIAENFAGVCPSRSPTGLLSGRTLSPDRKSTRLNSSHTVISYAVFCLKKKKTAGPGSGSAAIRPQLPLPAGVAR